jgi:hypothetical protein
MGVSMAKVDVIPCGIKIIIVIAAIAAMHGIPFVRVIIDNNFGIDYLRYGGDYQT